MATLIKNYVGKIPGEIYEFILNPGDTLEVNFDFSMYSAPYKVTSLGVGFANNEETGTDPNDTDPFAGREYSKTFKVDGKLFCVETGDIAPIDDDRKAFWRWYGGPNLAGRHAKFVCKNVGTKELFTGLYFVGGMGNM